MLLWLKRLIILSFMQTKFYKTIVLGWIPFIRFSLYYTSIRGWKYDAGYKHLQPGDFILAIDRHKLTTLLITGHLGSKASPDADLKFTHAGFCVAKGGNWEVSEMTHTNYTKSTFYDICKEADRVLICSCTDFNDAYRAAMVEHCKSYEKAIYDVNFKLDNRVTPGVNQGIAQLACSELVYESDFEGRLRVSLEDVAGLNRPYITPTGLRMAENIIVKWDSDQEQCPF